VEMSSKGNSVLSKKRRCMFLGLGGKDWEGKGSGIVGFLVDAATRAVAVHPSIELLWYAC